MTEPSRTPDDEPQLRGLDALASRLIASSTDFAVIINHGDGKVVDISLGKGLESAGEWHSLIGKRWADTLMKDSRGKVEQLMREAMDGHTVRGREVNQLVPNGDEVPFRFTGAKLDDERIVLFGQDLRPIGELQQRMVSAQQSMELEFARLRQSDTRYRVFFHITTEGVLVLQASNRRVLEANPAASVILGEPAEALQGRPIADLLESAEERETDAIEAMLAAAQTGVLAETLLQPVGQPDRTLSASASLFRQAGNNLALFRFVPSGSAALASGRTSRMMTAIESLPDGFVVTTEDCSILSANPGFCDLVQRANEQQLIGERLDRWLGRPGVDLNIILANVREHGVIRNFATIVRGDFGTPQEVTVTAVSALDGKVPCLGFTIRSVSSRIAALPTSVPVPRSIEQLRELVGRVSLKEIVKESVDLIERLCIEAALDVSGNNRAAAAQLLGLSRQGLYSKLRRHGLGELEPS